jgi:hypothetical protein
VRAFSKISIIKGEWFYGNARQMPKELQWVHFAKLTEHYGATGGFLLRKNIHANNAVEFLGGYIFFKIFGRPFMVINSGKAAVDLLEKRSKIYSDRPIRFDLFRFHSSSSN